MMEEKRGRNGTLIGDSLREPLVACALSYCSPKMDVWRKQEGRQQQHCLKGHSLRYNYLGESWEPGTGEPLSPSTPKQRRAADGMKRGNGNQFHVQHMDGHPQIKCAEREKDDDNDRRWKRAGKFRFSKLYGRHVHSSASLWRRERKHASNLGQPSSRGYFWLLRDENQRRAGRDGKIPYQKLYTDRHHLLLQQEREREIDNLAVFTGCCRRRDERSFPVCQRS